MQDPLNEDQQPTPKSWLLERVILINMGIFIYYNLLEYFYLTHYSFIDSMLFLLCLEVAQVSINLVLGLIFIFFEILPKIRHCHDLVRITYFIDWRWMVFRTH